MRTSKKFLILLIFVLFCSAKGYSQLSVSYYNSSLSKAGLAYNFSERFWSELRLYSNTGFDDITPELVICFNVVHKEFHNVYVGFGGNMNVLTGVVFPVGVQFIPLEKYKRISMHVELQPTYDVDAEFGLLQGAWGIRYRFGNKE
ncbi:hypothetical protein ACE01N_10110 [Saccharicrinis sp. FJH2]|uniref:hypothetical protein n=1 Tax=Saccharicrinis sp. FJH65 TaxID=3344659 RepID=UPI0035F4EEB0